MRPPRQSRAHLPPPKSAPASHLNRRPIARLALSGAEVSSSVTTGNANAPPCSTPKPRPSSSICASGPRLNALLRPWCATTMPARPTALGWLRLIFKCAWPPPPTILKNGSNSRSTRRNPSASNPQIPPDAAPADRSLTLMMACAGPHRGPHAPAFARRSLKNAFCAAL